MQTRDLHFECCEIEGRQSGLIWDNDIMLVS